MNTFFAKRCAPLLALVLAVFCTGCIVPKMYVDPAFKDATYQSIKPLENARPATIDVEFQFNGKKSGKESQKVVRRKVSRVLASTRAFAESSSGGAGVGTLKIVVNNYGNIGGAVGKGMVTGFTFGLVGSKVVDGYQMTATYTPPEGSPVTKEYKHALHTTVGLKSAPEGMQAVPMADAFDQVVEEMLLNFLRDLQKEGKI